MGELYLEQWLRWFTEHPAETAIGIIIIIGGYILYWELSKFWYPPIYTTSFDSWRVNRYIGRIFFKNKEDRRMFQKDTTVKTTKAKIAVTPWDKKLPILLSHTDILHHGPKKIIMGKKYIYWSEIDGAYFLSDKRPLGYMIRPDNLQRTALRKIDDIDTKSTRAARAAQQTVHQGLLQFSIPLDPGAYHEDDIDGKYGVNNANLFDKESIGGYKEMDYEVKDVKAKVEKPQRKGPSLKQRMRGDEKDV